ncbi:MAG: hypothetical protein AB7S26_22350 [Sandaracinaceae bacterium]
MQDDTRLAQALNELPAFAREPLGLAARPGGLIDCYALGAAWSVSTFIPTLRALARHDNASLDARDVVAYAYVVLGGMHERNRAPHAAIRALRRGEAIATSDHTRGRAHVELVGLTMQVGDLQASERWARRAAQIGAEHARSAAEALVDTVVSFRSGDQVWEVDERLARGHGHVALSLASAIEGRDGWRARLRCRGLLGRDEALRAMLAELERNKERRLSHADYFYLPDAWCDRFAELEGRLGGARSAR